MKYYGNRSFIRFRGIIISILASIISFSAQNIRADLPLIARRPDGFNTVDLTKFKVDSTGTTLSSTGAIEANALQAVYDLQFRNSATSGTVVVASGTNGHLTYTSQTLRAIIAAYAPAASVGANPTAQVNGTVVNGVATTFMPSDAAPRLADPFTPADGNQNITGSIQTTGRVDAGSTITSWGRPIFNEFNVLDYGAVGNGTTDDTVAIQRCLDTADQYGSNQAIIGGAKSGVTVKFPALIYKVSGLTIVNQFANPYQLTLSGAPGATLVSSDATGLINTINVPSTHNLSRLLIRDLTLESSTGANKNGLYVEGIQGALEIERVTVADNGSNGMELNTCDLGVVRQCYFHFNHKNGLKMYGGSPNGTTLQSNVFFVNSFSDTQYAGVNILGGETVRLQDNYFGGNGTNFIAFGDVSHPLSGLVLDHNFMEGSVRDIATSGTAVYQVKIINNTIFGGGSFISASIDGVNGLSRNGNIIQGSWNVTNCSDISYGTDRWIGATETPNNKAIQEWISTTRGILITRLTTTQKNAIGSPPESLFLYDSTIGVFNGYKAGWKPLAWTATAPITLSAAGDIGLTASLLRGNPTASVNGTATNGSASTFLPSDGAPALADPFTPADGTQNITGAIVASGSITGSNLSGTNTGDLSFAAPSGTINGTAVTGVATTMSRSDDRHALADPFTPADGNQNITGSETLSSFISATSATLTNFSAGSIPFFRSGGVLAQQNTKLFWDNSNNRLGLGLNNPSFPLEIFNSSTSSISNAISLRNATTAALGTGNSIVWFSSVNDSVGTYNSGRIYSTFDANSYTAGRTTISNPTGAGSWTDTLNIINSQVGILDTSPDFNLEVVGNFAVSNTAGGDGDRFKVISGEPTVTITPNFSSSGEDDYLFLDGGTVDVKAGVDNTTTSRGFMGTTTNHPLSLWTNGAQRVNISTAGNLGVGMDPVAGIDVDSTTVPFIRFSKSGTVLGSFGNAAVASSGVTGSVPGDAFIRAENHSIRLTVSGGTQTAALTSLSLTSAVPIVVSTVGKGFELKGGTNAKIGTGTLVAGTATISTTAVTANSRIFPSDTGNGGLVTNVGTLAVTAKNVGTSFVVTSTNPIDTSTFDWIIFEQN